MTAAEVAAATGGRVVSGDAGQRIERWSIDSRALAPGEVFIAIRGERFDGHDFAAGAFEHGAAGVVVEAARAAAVAGDRLVIAVDDTTRALQDVAREVRRRASAARATSTSSNGSVRSPIT